jgi:hypothetical protein
MKPRRLHLTSLHLMILAAAVALAAPAAYAFTIDNKSMNNSDGSPKFSDPDEAVQQFGNGGGSRATPGGVFQFGIRPSPSQNDRFDPPGWQPFPDRR